MESVNLSLGLFLSLLAGTMLGSFAWPMKKIKNWKWGNTWFIYSFWALILLLWFWAIITVPHLLFINGNVPIGVLLNVFFFGAGWGLVGIGFGIGLNTLGFAPGSAIILGLNNAVGAILPIILYTPEELNTPADIGISSGVGIISGEWKGTGRKPLITMIFGLMLLVTGISVTSWAGSL